MIGKRVRGALYFHSSAVDDVPREAKQALQAALDVAGDVAWNVARVEPSIVGLLLYDAFDGDAFPALLASTRVNCLSGEVSSRTFTRSANPLILHRKELLLSPGDPRRSTWAALTAALEARGLFQDPHLIGRRNAWHQRLAEAGVRVDGHKLCPI